MLELGSFGVKITFNNGDIVYIDPVTEEGFIEDEEKYIVDNGCYTYTYLKEVVNSIERYKICFECGYEKREDGWCKFDCPECVEG